MAQALPRMNVMGSRFASIGALRARQGSFSEIAVRGAGMIAALLVPLGIGAAIMYGFDRLANHIKANKEKTVLAEYYKPQIAKALNIDPDRVTTSELELAATVNPGIAKIVQNVEKQQASDNTISGLAAAGGVGASMLVPLPGAGLVGKLPHLAGIAGGMGGQALGSWLTSPDALKNPQVILEQLTEMREQGMVIAPIHTFMLRVAQNDALQKAIKEKTGSNYYELQPEQQAMLMSQFPRVAAVATKDADYLARGGDARELAFNEEAAMKWAGRVSRGPSTQTERA